MIEITINLISKENYNKILNTMDINKATHFSNWMKKISNIYQHDSVKMMRAFENIKREPLNKLNK